MNHFDITLISLFASLLSLFLSAITYWHLYLKKGKVLMTQSTLVAIINDPQGDGKKIYFRTLLFSTAKQGNILENMLVKLANNGNTQDFSSWFTVEKETNRASGLFISDTGCMYNHYFLISPRNLSYHFTAGQHEIQVYGFIFGNKNRSLLKKIELMLTSNQCEHIERGGGILFHWNIDKNEYEPEFS